MENSPDGDESINTVQPPIVMKKLKYKKKSKPNTTIQSTIQQATSIISKRNGFKHLSRFIKDRQGNRKHNSIDLKRLKSVGAILKSLQELKIPQLKSLLAIRKRIDNKKRNLVVMAGKV